MPQFDADAIRSRHLLADVATRYGLKLTADGREWKACCPFHSEKTPSFTIYHAGGGVDRFMCFGCGSHGDVIDFVQEWDSVTFREACESLDGLPDDPKPSPAARRNGHASNPYDGWTVAKPPDDAPLFAAGVKTGPTANPKRGRQCTYTPSLVHPYLTAAGDLQGYVLRIDIGDGRKITPTILWMIGPHGFEGWSHGSMPEPRPLYGLAEVVAHPTRQVLVVEGEKCADAGNTVLDGKLVVVSWCGGGKSAHKTDWTALRGRRCVLWPDADPEGLRTMETLAGSLFGLGARVRVLTPHEDAPKGWDIADAVADGWDGSRIIDYAKARARDWIGPQEKEVMPAETRKGYDNIRRPETRPHHIAPRGDGGAALVDGTTALKDDDNSLQYDKISSTSRHAIGNVTALFGGSIPAPDDLDNYRIHFVTDEHGKLTPRIDKNYFWMLRGHPAMRGIFALNMVEHRPFLMARPPWDRNTGHWQARPLSEWDVGETLMWLQTEGLRPKKQEARDAIKLVASYTQYNPVHDYLARLQWDGCPRLQGGAWESDTVPPLSTEYLGAPPDEIFATFVTKWHIAAVARTFRPGCKADSMVIFESPQGKFKSTYLRKMATIDGHEYFADSLGDITNAGSIMLLQGTWIVEVAELSGFDRKEVNSIKAWLSRTTDRYVPKYEGEPREVPRNYIVAGTHNPSGHGYLKDPTGARRFWPVPIIGVDLDRVECDRDQIWAEAVHLFKAGMKWWLTTDEERQADELTGERRVEHPWESKIDEAVRRMPTITLSAVIGALNIPIGQQTELTTKIVSERLRAVGYSQGRDKTWRRNGAAVQGEML